MAIVHSHSMNGGKKSAGMITYRSVRGRLIASQKRQGSDASKAAAYSNEGLLNVRCSNFAMINLFIAAHRNSINNSFDKTKFGSQGNHFYKVNRVPLEAALISFAQAGGVATLAQIEGAIATYAQSHPNEILRIKKAGYDKVYLSGAWDDAQDPVAEPILSTMNVSINEQYQLTSVAVTGSNLNAAMKAYVGNVMISGSWNIDTYGTSGTFTPSVQSKINGTQNVSVKWNSATLMSRQVSGDQTPAVTSIELTLSGRNIAAASVNGALLSDDLVCKYNSQTVTGEWAIGADANSAVFTPATPIQRVEGTSQFGVYKADGTTLLNSVSTEYIAPIIPKVSGITYNSDYSSPVTSIDKSIGGGDSATIFVVGTNLPTSGTAGFPTVTIDEGLTGVSAEWIAVSATNAKLAVSNSGSSSAMVTIAKTSEGNVEITKKEVSSDVGDMY